MRKAIIFLIVSIFIVSLITGCSKSPVSPAENQDAAGEQLTLNCFKEKELIAGQNLTIGKVKLDYQIHSGEPFLYVEFYIYINNDWYITETHVYFGEDAPAKHSPGKFPYKHEGGDIAPLAKVDSYLIPLPTDWEFFWFSAHAVVINIKGGEETAWGENEYEFEHGWGWYCKIPNPAYAP